MKRFLGTDSPLFRFMTILLELAEINLLFILCSLPVVTMGASYATMTDSMNEMHVHGEGCFTAKRFFQVFKKSLKPMIPIGTVILSGIFQYSAFIAAKTENGIKMS